VEASVIGQPKKVHHEMIGMGVEARTVVRAEAADFFCECWAVEVPSDERVGHVLEGVHYHAQGLGLESFQDFNVVIRFQMFYGSTNCHCTLYVQSVIVSSI
jgi:hypothetical protein